jgi:hypothetical protein
MCRPRWRRWIVERVGLQPLIEGDDLPGRRTSRDQLGHLPEEVLEAVGLMTSMMSAGTQEPAKTDLALRHTRILVFARVTIRRAHEAD